ncbi:MAG: His/Gly/Thr/Pro-type tRNA ligase C-terminal domain-containing protein, partial [Geminicoccaceae bacterium]
VVPIGEATETAALLLAEELRAARIPVELEFRGKVGQRLKRAAQRNARFAILLGEDELAAEKVVLRDLDQGAQQDIARAELVARIAALGVA